VDAALSANGGGNGWISTAIAAANQAARGGGATTLVVAVLQRSGEISLARVGDSSAFLVDADDGASSELFASPEVDTIGASTAALPADEVQPEATTATLDARHVLVLVTDGIADPWRDGPTTVAPVLATALAEPPTPLELAQLADFSRQGCHDDRTLLAVWPRPGADPVPPGG
jgi:serine/threonine protein phosphatase PrpC